MAQPIELDRAFVAGWLSYKGKKTVYMEEEEYHEALLIEEWYKNNESPKVERAIAEMILELPKHEREEIRRCYLAEKIVEVKERFLQTNNEDDLRELKRLQFEAKLHLGQVEGYNVEQLVKARTFPLENLIKHRNYMAKCPFHPDSSPSLNIKKNYYYCHGCGATGDVIDFVMKRDGLTFKEAVNRLAVSV